MNEYERERALVNNEFEGGERVAAEHCTTQIHTIDKKEE